MNKKESPYIIWNKELYENDSEFRKLMDEMLDSDPDSRVEVNNLEKKYNRTLIDDKIIYWKKGTDRPKDIGAKSTFKSLAKVAKVMRGMKF